MNDTLKIAFNELGTSEVPGQEHNQRIIDYAQKTGIGWITSDEEAWCSTFVNFVMKKANREFSGKANARSWKKVGLKVNVPRPGDVVVFWRESKDSWKGHVAIFLGFTSKGEKGGVWVVGGNQNNSVTVTDYPNERILEFRRPAKRAQTSPPSPTLKPGDRRGEVKQLQRFLEEKGFNTVYGADGIYGDSTVSAVKALQKDLRVTIDGIYGHETYNAL